MPTVSPGRIPPLDALRFAGVLAVVALHAGVAYSTVVPWWYVKDPEKSRWVDLVLAVADGFPMPLLFAVSGFFALPSLNRRGAAGFVAGKVWRLLVPLIGLTVLYCPVIAYVDFLDKGGRAGFFEHWLALLPSLADWGFRYFSGTQATAASREMIWPYHLWFLAMLFVFCLALAAARGVAGPGLTRQMAGRGAGWGRFCGLACGVGLAAGLGQLVWPDAAWGRLGPFLAFQPARVPQYVGFFLLGAFAWRRGWFVTHAVPGGLWRWGIGAAVLLVLLVASRIAATGAGSNAAGFLVAHGLARTGFALAVMGLLAVAMARTGTQSLWRRPGVSAASFNLYLLHFPPIIVMQYVLIGTGLPIAVKFALCFLVPTAACLGLGRLFGRRRRILVPVVVAVVFGLCLALWRSGGLAGA
ncbi:acyltransferase family protein [Solidesulfovibrio sp.]